MNIGTDGTEARTVDAAELSDLIEQLAAEGKTIRRAERPGSIALP